MSNIRFLLVNPIDTQVKIENLFPNLGLGNLASFLRREAPSKIEFKIVSGNMAEEISAWQPNIVGITSVSQCYNEAMACAKIAKAAHLPVIIGGDHISALPQTLTPDMDVGVIGEGETTIVELMALFAAEGKFYSRHLASVSGIAYWGGGAILKTKTRDLIQPLDSIPFPARDILKIDRHTSMFSSRGCPYRCTFCFSSRFWNKVRFFSAEYVVEEIGLLYGMGVRHISFLDDLFIADKQRVMDIAALLGKKNLLGKLTYTCNVRSNLVTDELAKMLRSMGVKSAGMGLESGCQSTLEYLKGKGNITVADHAKAIKTLKDNGVACHVSFIIGSPLEDRDSILETIKFIKDNGLTANFEVYVLTPFPGTPVWDYALSRGLVSNDMDWKRLHIDFGPNPNPVILSEKLTEQELRVFYNQLQGRRKRYMKEYQLRDMLKQGIRHPVSVPKYVLRRCANVFGRSSL